MGLRFRNGLTASGIRCSVFELGSQVPPNGFLASGRNPVLQLAIPVVPPNGFPDSPVPSFPIPGLQIKSVYPMDSQFRTFRIQRVAALPV